MSDSSLLSDVLWESLLPRLRQQPGIYIGRESDCRRFIEAVLWIDRSGAQWRLLPPSYGNWNSIFKRFNRWSERGIWQQVFEQLTTDADLEHLLIDSTVLRAHACSAGAKGGKKTKV